jgi:hypothetical protein
MKAQEFYAALMAFAPLAEVRRTQELQSFASIFNGGKAETVAQRLKLIPAGIGLPASVKASLAAIEAGLNAFGAKKQEADVKAVLSKFSGPFDGTVNDLVARVKTAMASPPAKGGAKKAVASADEALAKELVDELTQAVLDTRAFSRVVQRLSDAKQVSTPTLHMIGNRFLGNSKAYKGRKTVIADIEKRQREDMLDSSRRAAVKRAG